MKIVFATYCLFITMCVYCQSENTYLNNDSVHYSIIISKNPLLKKQANQKGKYFVVIEMPKSIEKSFRSKPVDYWMQKLSDKSSDWAANLVLYCIYQRDATIPYFINGDKKKWDQAKITEIEYWRHFLTQQRKTGNHR